MHELSSTAARVKADLYIRAEQHHACGDQPGQAQLARAAIRAANELEGAQLAVERYRRMAGIFSGRVLDIRKAA